MQQTGPGSTGASGSVRVGTSGWSYPHWRGPFYPDSLPAEQMLAHYARHFRAVEVNNTFYRLPETEVLSAWRDAVPDGFTFAVKASRYITHMKKLKDCGQALADFLGRVAILGDALGPVLFQLPPRWHFNGKRLANFLDSLSGEFRYVFEFRDHSWLEARTYALLAEHNVALCIYELDGFVSPGEITAELVYLRLHGPAGAYQGSYDRGTLSTWAGRIRRWAGDGLDVHCYFDNDQAGYAADNARTLASLLAPHGHGTERRPPI